MNISSTFFRSRFVQIVIELKVYLGSINQNKLSIFQSRAGRSEKTSEDVQREKEARQVRRHAGRGSEQARASGSPSERPRHHNCECIITFCARQAMGYTALLLRRIKKRPFV